MQILLIVQLLHVQFSFDTLFGVEKAPTGYVLPALLIRIIYLASLNIVLIDGGRPQARWDR